MIKFYHGVLRTYTRSLVGRHVGGRLLDKFLANVYNPAAFPWYRARMKKRNASWTASSGEMVFVMPDGTVRCEQAHRFDHPVTVCKVLDLVAGLSPYERRTVISMLSEFEMRAMYPDDDREKREV